MRKLVIGVNDLGTTNPELIPEWHPTLNGELTPQDFAANSNKKARWKCAAGHEWEAVIKNRSRGASCLVCWKSPVLGVNDLGTTNPELIREWHPTLNGELTPQDFARASSKSAWWICDSGHVWKAVISTRSKGGGCWACWKSPVLGVNDLGTTNPELIPEWHPTLNGELTPKDFASGSQQKVHWVCATGHEWGAKIAHRANGTGCPTCYVSFAGIVEGRFRDAFNKCSYFSFKSDIISIFRLSRKLNKAQIDMLNDGLKLVIEYDGEWTHGDRNPERKTLARKLAEDKETTQALVAIGYKVIRIREYSSRGMLPFIPIDPEYEFNVFQITYKSFGEDKDDIEQLVRRIIEEKADWFKASSELMLVS